MCAQEDNIKRAERSEGRALGLTAVQRSIAEHEQHDENSVVRIAFLSSAWFPNHPLLLHPYRVLSQEYSSDASSSASDKKKRPRFSKQLVSTGCAPLPDMPVWDECTTCGSLFEVLLQHEEAEKSLCPDCGTEVGCCIFNPIIKLVFYSPNVVL